MLDAFVERGVAAPAVDLGPAREARLDLVPEHVARHFAPKLFDELRALGAGSDQAHVAAEHVPELREFVKAPSPQHAPDRGLSVVVRLGPDRAGVALGTVDHRAELQHLKHASVESHPALSEQNRDSVEPRDQGPDADHQRGQKGQDEGRDHDVEQAFLDRGPPHQGALAQSDDGEPVEVFDTRAESKHLQQVGDHPDVDEFVVEHGEDVLLAVRFAAR